MRRAVQAAARAKATQVLAVAAVHREERAAELHATELVESRAVELAWVASGARALAGDARARERVAVRVQTTALDADEHVAFADGFRAQQGRARTRADDETGDVVLAVDVEPGHLRGLAAEQRRAVLAARERHARDDALEPVGVEAPGREVIEEEERFGAHHGDVVDAVIHEVLPDGVVRVEEIGEAQLCPDAV